MTVRSHPVADVYGRVREPRNPHCGAQGSYPVRGTTPPFRVTVWLNPSSPLLWLLLLNTNRCLQEIADTTGFADAVHFSRTFRKITGASPGAWRADMLT